MREESKIRIPAGAGQAARASGRAPGQALDIIIERRRGGKASLEAREERDPDRTIDPPRRILRAWEPEPNSCPLEQCPAGSFAHRSHTPFVPGRHSA